MVYKSCVGEPLRQIEDPQSPPCVASWQGDNGGATATGVTRSTINIVMPELANASDDPGLLDALQRFFNARFMFYGRSIHISQSGPVNGDDCDYPTQRSYADGVIGPGNLFASMWYSGCGGWAYMDELAHHGVISAAAYPGLFESYMTQERPYVWDYQMEMGRLRATMGEYACKRLAGGNAVHGGPTVKSMPRVFGAIIESTNTYPADSDPTPLESGLAECGVKLKTYFTTNGFQSTTQAAGQMKDAGVTTVICFCLPSTDTETISNSAAGQGYFPEWLLSSDFLGDSTDGLGKWWNQSELPFVFGLTFVPRQLRVTNEPARWAQTGGGDTVDPSSDPGEYSHRNDNYRSLLLLASGIQMAGPNLTPQTFEAGLERTVFPNPDPGLMAGHVGFGGGSHSMTLDAAEWWWSNQAPSPYSGEPPGSLCYVDHGARHSGGDWPSQDELQNGVCDSLGPP